MTTRYVIFTCVGVMILMACSRDRERSPLGETVIIQRHLDSIEVAHSQDRFSRSIELFRELRQIPLYRFSRRDVDRYHHYLALTAFEVGDYEVAVEASAARILDSWGIDPTRNGELALSLAHALKKAGDTVRAIDWYRTDISDPTPHHLRDVNSNLATLFATTHRYDSALARLKIADDLHIKDGLRDMNGIAWSLFTRAICEAGLGNYSVASMALASGISLLEERREFRDYVESDVRLSLYHSIWRDSVRLRGIGDLWQSHRDRLLRLQLSDSLQLARSGVPKYRNTVALTSLRHEFSMSPTWRLMSIPFLLNRAMVTSMITDTRGWQWIGTLRGLCLRMGTKAVQVDIGPMVNNQRPVKALRQSTAALLIDRYDGSTETVSWERLIAPFTTPKPPLHPNIMWEWHAWHGEAPTAVVGTSSRERTLFFYDDRVGFAPLGSEPLSSTTISTVSGAPWLGTVRCGLAMTDSTLLLGTSRGLWTLNLGSLQISQLTVAPDHVNRAVITTLGMSSDSTLRVTMNFDNPVVFNVTSSGGMHLSVGQRLRLLYFQDPAFATFSSFSSTINNQQMDSLDPLTYPTDVIPRTSSNIASWYHSVLSPSLRILYRASTILILDSAGPTLTAHITPQEADLSTSLASGTVVLPRNMFGIHNTKGLLLGTIHPPKPIRGRTSVAWRASDQAPFTVSADGADIMLEQGQRSLELIIGRPHAFGSLSIPQTISVPWSESAMQARTGEGIAIANIPAGEHDILIRSEDNVEHVVLRIHVAPTLVESRWFQALVIAIILGLGVGTTRYVLLLRRRRIENQERAMLEERVQIGQDLHDAVGADIVRINMLVKGQASASTNAEVGRVTREASRTLRDIIWSVSARHELDAAIAILAERCRTIADEAGIMYHVDLPLKVFALSLPPQSLRDITLIFTEALTNIIKHAEATEIRFVVTSTAERTTIIVIDNGRGFSGTPTAAGIGLASMRHRAQRSDLILNVDSSTGSGTTISLTISV